MPTDHTGERLFDRGPGCNALLPMSGGWHRRCGDLDTKGFIHLCPGCERGQAIRDRQKPR